MENNDNVQKNTTRFFWTLVVVAVLVVGGSYAAIHSGQTGIIDNQAMTVIASPAAMIASPTLAHVSPISTCKTSANGTIETATNAASTVEAVVCNPAY
jgi:hypothetical protein